MINKLSTNSNSMLVTLLIMLTLLAVTSSMCPGGCRCNKYKSICLDIDRQGLPQGFDSTTERLQVKYVNITEINPNETSKLGLSFLKELELDKVLVIRIKTGSFLGLKTLESLTIRRNIIQVLETGTFKYLHKLQKLDLEANGISTLQPRAFEGLYHLRHLNLRANLIKILEKGVFDGMRQSKTCYLTKTESVLDLSQNKINFIKPYTFNGLCGFTKLILEYNNFLSFSEPNMFFGLTDLKFLDIKKYTLKLLPYDYFQIGNASINEILNGLTNLKALDLADTGLDSSRLGESAFQSLKSITTLDLKLNRISYLKTGTFNGLSTLRELSLAGNTELNSVQGKLFQSLVSLRKLDLFACGIYLIHPEAFLGLNNLWFLDLSSNPIFKLTAGIFSHLVSLRYLNIRYNWIHTIDNNAFVGLRSLKYLDIFNAGEKILTNIQFMASSVWTTRIIKPLTVQTLYEEFFQNVYTGLDIIDTKFSTLHSDIFSDLSRLDTLSFTHNFPSTGSQQMKLSGLQVAKSLYIHVHNASNVRSALDTMLQDVSYFQELTLTISGIQSLSQVGNMSGLRLKYLDLSNHSFPVIRANSFIGLTTLTSLYLKICNIETIVGASQFTQGAFNGLENLVRLDLSYNKLTVLDSGVFVGLNNLKTLSLINNYISSIKPGAFKGLYNLVYLDVLNNNITAINEGVFKELFNVKEIRISNNVITLVKPGAFEGLINTEMINLDDNKISTLTPGIFSSLSNLRELYIGNNCISSLTPGVFYGLKNIDTIDLQYNNISYLDAGVFGAVCEEDFNITYESIKKPNHNFCNLTNTLTQLQNLYLNDNNISYIHPHTFLYCNELRLLFLKGNRFLAFDTNFLYNLKLDMLSFGSCNITDLPANAFEFTPRLSYLYLDDNKLSSINSSVLLPLRNLYMFILFKNNLACDCQLKKAWKLCFDRDVEFLFQCGDHKKVVDSKNFIQFLQCNNSSPRISAEGKSTDDSVAFKVYIEPVILSIVFSCGLIGNGLILYICLRYRNMRTFDNVCVFNLAVSDILSLILNFSFSLMEVLEVQWELGLELCQFFMMFKELSIAVSVYSAVAMALERYIVTIPNVSHEVSAYGVSLSKIRAIIISLLWVFSILFSASSIFSASAGVRCLDYHPQSVDFIRRRWTIQLLVFCLIPALGIFVFNGGTADNLRTSVRNIGAMCIIPEAQQFKRRKTVANIMDILPYVFVLSNFPTFLLRVFVAWSFVYTSGLFYIQFVTYCLFFFNSIINPISLFIMSSQFRSHLLEFVQCFTRDKPVPDPTPFTPVSERDMELQQIHRDRLERLAKMREKYM